MSARLDRCYLSYKCWWICTYIIQLSVISILVEGYHFTPILSVRNEPNNIYHWWNEQNKKERAKNWTLRNASEWGVTRGGWGVNSNKDERFVKYEWIQVWTVSDKPNVFNGGFESLSFQLGSRLGSVTSDHQICLCHPTDLVRWDFSILTQQFGTIYI